MWYRTLTISAALIGAASALTAVAVASGRVVGIGSTKAAFATHHHADPDPKLVPGCCFGPRESDGSDHIDMVRYAAGRVVGYEIRYLPTVPLRVAEAELAQELPSDAKLRYRLRKGQCEVRQYTSALLLRLDGPVKKESKKVEALLGGKEEHGLVDVGLYSSETGLYDGRAVESVLLSRGYNAADKTNAC